MSELEQAIEGVYEAFSDVVVPRVIEGCDHCHDGNEIERLLEADVRKAPKDLMSQYGSSVFSTLGSKRDFLYFLPRILELNAIDHVFWPSPEVVGRAIATSEPATWTDGQRQAVAGLYQAMIGHCVSTGSFDPIGGWVCGAARAGFDVRRRRP